MTTATTSEPGTAGGFGIMRAMDDVELTEDEINDLLSGDDQGAGWDEEDGYEWVS